MTNVTTYAAMPQCSRRAQTHATKTPCEQLARFDIEADHCPQVLLRVLGVMARDGTVPVTIAVTRTLEAIEIVIELDGATAARCEHLKYRVEEFPAVRRVALSSIPRD